MKKHNQSKKYENKGFIKQKPKTHVETLEELFIRYETEDNQILMTEVWTRVWYGQFIVSNPSYSTIVTNTGIVLK